MLNAFLLMTVVSLVTWNLPFPAPRERLRPVVAPLVYALGLQQDWRVFSPDPDPRSLFLRVRFLFRDGSVEVFSPPHHGPWLGTLHEYHWRKWSRRIADDETGDLREAAVRHFALRYADDPRGLESVVLVQRWAEVPVPGSAKTHQWDEEELYTLDVRAETVPGE